MPVSTKQLTICDFSSDFEKFFNQNQTKLLTLLDKFIDISSYIPHSFYKLYYRQFGRDRKYSLESMISFFILKNILCISSIDTMINILSLSSELRSYCGFFKIPHKSQFSRFKSEFLDDINNLFHNLVDYTEDISKVVNPFLSSILITDTTGFEHYVKENNPKFYQGFLSKAKAYKKVLSKTNDAINFNIDKHAQSHMPKSASSNKDSKLCFLNGHFGYFQKTIISTNGFGLIRDINFYEADNSLSIDLTPNEIKDIYDAKSLIPTLETFFSYHPNLEYKYFIGDSGFDADDNYAYLHEKNIMPIIAINPRNSANKLPSKLNEVGVPLCPKDDSLAMVYDGITRQKNRADRIKYICPKAKKTRLNGKTTYLLNCESPCTKSKCGKIKQLTIHHNYRYNSSFPRDSLKWIKLFKLRTRIERTISQIKNFVQIRSLKIQNTKSLKSEIILACISQLIAFILLYHVKDDFKNPLAIKALAA